MAQREDGRETRNRLLNAACEIFALKGYPAAKVSEICSKAGANIASVNYYFGDKANLYAAAWRHAFERLEEPIFGAAGEGSPREQLQVFVRTLMRNFLAQGALGDFSRLYLMELVQPTGLIQDVWIEMVEPKRRKLRAIISKLIGAEASEEKIHFCELSIISQCRTLVTIQRHDLEFLLGQPLGPEVVDRLADHIAKFSLAGIQAVAGD